MPSIIIWILLHLLNIYCCPCALEREACMFFSQKPCFDFCASIYLHSGYSQSEQWWKDSINQDHVCHCTQFYSLHLLSTRYKILWSVSKAAIGDHTEQLEQLLAKGAINTSNCWVTWKLPFHFLLTNCLMEKGTSNSDSWQNKQKDPLNYCYTIEIKNGITSGFSSS